MHACGEGCGRLLRGSLCGCSCVLEARACVQASRVRFIFRDDSLEVVLGEAQEETENAFVGGENKWAFQAFTNWEYWWPGFPVLVYFKVGMLGCWLRACMHARTA